MRSFKKLIPWVGLLLLAALTWWALGRPPPVARWVEVEAPRRATAGGLFTVHVVVHAEALPRSADPLRLSVDLHGFTGRHEWLGCVSSGNSHPVIAANRAVDFVLQAPTNPHLDYVAVVVYASPTGDWNDHVDVASSEEVPLFGPATADAPPVPVRPLAVYQQIPGEGVVRADVPAVSLVLALGWMTCGWQWWRRRSNRQAAGRAFRVVALAAVFAAAWELLPLEQILGERARAFATAHHWYNMRMGFQHVFTVAIVVASAALILTVWRSTSDYGLRFGFFGMALYAGITLAAFLSLHVVDAVLALSFASVPLIQIVQLGALALALTGVAIDARQDAAKRS